MTRALVTQLLEALLTSSVNEDNLAQTTEAITAAREYLATEPDPTLTEALAQSVEPVAWRWDILPDSPLMKRKGQKSGVYLENPKDIGIDVNGVKSLENYKWTPLYLHPPQPQAATPTPEEIRKIMLASELKTLARKGCGDCYQQDCNWPECSPKAMALKQAAAQGEKP